MGVVVAHDAQTTAAKLPFSSHVVLRRDQHSVMHGIAFRPGVRDRIGLDDDACAPFIFDSSDEKPATFVRVLQLRLAVNLIKKRRLDLDHLSSSQKCSLKYLLPP